MTFRVALMSGAALIAFAGNSVLCRLALSDGSIHPASFTSIRLVSGAVTLLLLVWLSKYGKERSTPSFSGGWVAPTMLFTYAALFSFAYISLDTGVGALILFGSVQITMVLISLYRGNRLNWGECFGLLLACSGLVYLVFPELSEPSLEGFIMMSVAGVAWGVYTILGQGSEKPLADTASNFTKSISFAVILSLPFLAEFSAAPKAWALAVASGALTSGVGYAIWYAALRHITTSQAGVMQLLVPIIAAIGGVVFSNEILTYRLLIASLLTLGGFLIVMASRQRIA